MTRTTLDGGQRPGQPRGVESPYAGNTGDPFANQRRETRPWQPHPSVAKDAAKFGQQPRTSGGTEHGMGGV